MTKFILISIFPFLHLPGVEKLFKILFKKVVCHSPYDSRLPPVYSNLASWSHLGTKAASGAHLSTSHKIQQYLSPTSENICQIFVGKHLLREMHLCWLNFLPWYNIYFSFVSNCSWQYCSGFSRFFFSQRQKVIISWTMEWQNVDQQIQLKTIFLQVKVLHWCEHWPICQSRRTASVTNTLSNLRQIRKKCYVGHQSERQIHFAIWDKYF